MDADHDDIFNRSAPLAYYYFLAVFPGLLMVMGIVGVVVGRNPDFQNILLQHASRPLPPAAWQLVQRTLAETAHAVTGSKFIVGLVGALWSTSSGTSSTMTV